MVEEPFQIKYFKIKTSSRLLTAQPQSTSYIFPQKHVAVAENGSHNIYTKNKIFNWQFGAGGGESPPYNNNFNTQTLNNGASFTRALLFRNKGQRQTLLCSYSALIGPPHLLFYLLMGNLRLRGSFRRQRLTFSALELTCTYKL